jgi:hypothetical protein
VIGNARSRMRECNAIYEEDRRCSVEIEGLNVVLHNGNSVTRGIA